MEEFTKKLDHKSLLLNQRWVLLNSIQKEKDVIIFKEEGVPVDITWLAQVESAWKPKAMSWAAASGLWQFVPGTGRQFGLRQTAWIDERNGFEQATRASAKYLKSLAARYNGNWELAMAAYNTGAGWRKIVEEMHQSATLAEWYRDKGRHPVYAHGKRVPLPAFTPAPIPSTLPVFEPGLPAAAHTATPGLTTLPSFSGASGK